MPVKSYDRVGTLRIASDRPRQPASQTSPAGTLSAPAPHRPMHIARLQVDVVTPTGKLLARRLSLLIEQGHSVLVTGPNGSGKSSLFRILGGLWPMTSGSIHHPAGAGTDGRIFYVPQKPYTTIGTLREQVLASALMSPRPQKFVIVQMLIKSLSTDQRLSAHEDTLQICTTALRDI